MQNIVLATDFLESSRLALDYAVAFSHRYNSKLTIFLPVRAASSSFVTPRWHPAEDGALPQAKAPLLESNTA